MYTVVFTKAALKDIKKFDKPTSKLILAWIRKNLDNCSDPRKVGKPLKGDMRNYWRYRVGDYRILSAIQDEIITIQVIHIGHRKEIYK